MRIFQGLHNVAGAPSIMSAALRHHGVEATSYCFGTGRANYAVDVELRNDSDQQRKAQGKQLLATALKEFDVFHFHYGESILGPNFADVPILKKNGKKVFFHFHGCDVRDSKAMFHVLHSPCRPCWPMGCSANRNLAVETAEKYADGIFVSTPDLLQYFPNARLFLQPLDPGHLEQLSKISFQKASPKKNEPLRIAHAPSNRIMKGTAHIADAVKDLQKTFDVEFDIIEGETNKEVISRFQKAHLVIDQMYTGCYGTVSVEAMAIGRPVMSFIAPEYQDIYPPDLPIIPISPKTILPTLKAILEDPEHLNMLGFAGQRYVHKHHTADQAATTLLTAYKKAG